MKNKGITLIALIVSIIIILIISGIAINTLTNSGIFERAKEARNKWQNAQNEEEMQIAKYSNQIESYIGNTRNTENQRQTIQTTFGYWNFEKTGNIVYCDFWDTDISIAGYKNDSTGIVLESLPFAIDKTKYNLRGLDNGEGDYRDGAEPKSYFTTSIYGSNQSNPIFIRLLENEKLQVFFQSNSSSDSNRTISGMFRYFTKD